VTSDQSQVEMVFWSIQQADFGIYYMMAENDIGSSEVTIVLHAAYDSAHPQPAPASRMEQLQQLFAQSADCKYCTYYCTDFWSWAALKEIYCYSCKSFCSSVLQFFDAVGWVKGRAIPPVKKLASTRVGKSSRERFQFNPSVVENTLMSAAVIIHYCGHQLLTQIFFT